MVMHARKLSRISDGFSDKHQSHSSYESAKYSSSGGSGSGGTSKYRSVITGGNVATAPMGTYPDKRLDSPSTNSLRSSSPDSRSQSPRYHKSSSGGSYYKREAYRDREREFASREYRDNRDGSRSPKERRRDVRDRNLEHASRNSAMKKESGGGSSSGQQCRVGDWSEHVSSSGKRYYYNCRTEVSQWEKPLDWLEWEQHAAAGGTNRHSNAGGGGKTVQQQHLNYNNQHSSSTVNKGGIYSSSGSSSSKITYNNLNHPNSKGSSNYSSNNISSSYSSSKTAYSSSASVPSVNLQGKSSAYSSSSLVNNSSNLATTNLVQQSSSTSSSCVASSHHQSSSSSQQQQQHHHHQQQQYHLHSSSSVNCSNNANSNSGIKDGQHRGVGPPQLDKTKPDKHSNVDGSTREHHYRTGEDPHTQQQLHYDLKRDNRKYGTPAGQDMEISSGGSTPTSESIMSRVNQQPPADALRNKLHHTAISNSNSCNNSSSSSLLMPATCLVPSSLSSINLHHHHHHQGTSLPPLINSHPRLSCSASNSNVNNNTGLTNTTDSRHYQQQHHSSFNSSNNNNNLCANTADGGCSTKGGGHLEPLCVNTSISTARGPPTPTHSETHDCIDVRKADITGPNGSSTRLSAVSSGLTGSCSSVAGSALSSLGAACPTSSSSSPSTTSWGGVCSQRPAALTPSLTNYYNEALITHVKDWPAENIEKQCQRLSEEAHTTGSLIMTKVSADLKMARSLVRLAEIQATLREQRILSFRAQKRQLEDMSLKGQNSFMCDNFGNS